MYNPELFDNYIHSVVSLKMFNNSYNTSYPHENQPNEEKRRSNDP